MKLKIFVSSVLPFLLLFLHPFRSVSFVFVGYDSWLEIVPSLFCFDPWLIPFLSSSQVFGNYFDGKCTSLAAQVDEVIHEMVSGIRTLRILGIERYFINRFEKLSAQYALVKIKDSFSKGFGFGISELFPFLSQGVLLYYGMQLVADGDYSVTEVMLIFTILLFSITSISVLITAIPQMQKPLVIMVRILHLLDYDPSKSREAQGAKIKMGLTGSSISFKTSTLVTPCHVKLILMILRINGSSLVVRQFLELLKKRILLRVIYLSSARSPAEVWRVLIQKKTFLLVGLCTNFHS